MLYSFQRGFIYFPTHVVNHDFEEIEFENDGEKIRLISLNRTAKNAVLYFGGNAESVAYTAQEFEHNLPSFSVYLVNYRGYAGSSGFPSEQGLYSDALSIYDKLDSQYANVFVFGRSLGSGVATYLASKRPIPKLVLITPFDSIQSVAQKQFPYFPMSILLKDKFDSAGRASKITSDTLVIVAKNDTIVGQEHSENLITKLKEINPTVVVIERAGHNDISDSAQYYNAIRGFLN